MADGDFGTAVAQRIKERVPASRTIAGKPLTGDVTLGPGDVGAAAATQGAKADSALRGLGPALERLRALRDFGVGNVRMAVVGDSTGNDAPEWARLFHRRWGATLPSQVTRLYRNWTGSAWSAETIDQDSSLHVVDTFSRTGDIGGSTPDQGPAWGGGSNPDRWQGTGTTAVHTPGGSSGGLYQDIGSVSMSATLTMELTTTSLAANQILRIYLSANPAQTKGVWGSLTLFTSGGVTLSLHKTIDGTTTTVASAQTLAGITPNSGTPQTVVLTITVNGTEVTASAVAGGQTTNWSGSIVAGDIPALATYFIIAPSARPATDPFGVVLDEVDVQSASSAASLEMHNASIAGATLETFDAALRASMFGDDLYEIIVLNFGHNGGQSPTDFITSLAAWVDAWKVEHPESEFLLMSQNPQKAPSATIAAHAARLAALRTWAAGMGHAYVPVWETFRARPDGGESLVLPDGVHPTSPTGGATTGDFGSVVWAEAVESLI